MLHDYRDNTLSDFYGDVRPGFDDRREIDVDRGHFVIRFWIAGANAGANRRRRFANLLMCRQLRFIAFTFAMQRSRVQIPSAPLSFFPKSECRFRPNEKVGLKEDALKTFKRS